jgi:hypothetical protein
MFAILSIFISRFGLGLGNGISEVPHILQLILPDVHLPDDKSLYEPIKDNIANILDITGTSSLEIVKFITTKGINLQILLLPHNFNFFKYHICQYCRVCQLLESPSRIHLCVATSMRSS